MTTIDQQKYMSQGFSFFQEIFDHSFPLFALRYGYLCKSIPWQINQPPFGYDPFFINTFDSEMIDELCFTRSCRCFRKFINISEHIDKRGFAHIASSNKCIFRKVSFRTILIRRATDYILSGADFHRARYDSVSKSYDE